MTDRAPTAMLDGMVVRRALVLITLLATTGCMSSSTSEGRDPGDKPPIPAAKPIGGGVNAVTKMLVFVVENKSREQMVRGLPWVARLGRKYGTTTDFHGITHPSLPNYLVMAGGSTFGIEDDGPPSAHSVSGPSVFGSAIEAGRTARVYAESMTRKCQANTAGRYAVKHNPWAYFQDEAAPCAKNDVPFDRFRKDVKRGRLPTVGMVIPNMCNDGHDCPLSVTNGWLRREIKRVLHGPDWADGHLAIVVTADEDDGDHDQQVLTVVAHPYLDHAVVDRYLDHYGLSRAYAEVSGTDLSSGAAGASSLLAAFGLGAGS